MATKLEQVLALTNGRKVAQSITLDDFPTLQGSRPDQIAQFNNETREWKRRTEVRLSEQIIAPKEG